MSRLFALLLLAWSLVRSLVDGLFGRRRGVAQFRLNYAEARLPPMTAEDRVLLPLLSGCIACGLCDVGSVKSGTGAMQLALSDSRSMPDYDAALVSLAATSEAELLEAEALCPTRVPLRRIAAFVRAKARA